MTDRKLTREQIEECRGYVRHIYCTPADAVVKAQFYAICDMAQQYHDRFAEGRSEGIEAVAKAIQKLIHDLYHEQGSQEEDTGAWNLDKRFCQTDEAYDSCLWAIHELAAQESKTAQRSEAEGPAKGGKRETAPCQSSDHPTAQDAERLAAKEHDRQYHMDAINRLASFLGFHGTSFEVVQAAMDNMTRMARELAALRKGGE